MCGIVGTLVFSNGNYSVSKSLIDRMRDAMAHRGPDGAGSWVSEDRKVGLGHRRLAIVDLSDAASQPMSITSESLWIVFNGEIYNHAEIRCELEELGYSNWKTDHSDTEVVLRAFEHWGVECVDRFIGMYAIALWDTRTRELWLIRDRLGVKPLYYSIHSGRISFASEIKALLIDPDQKRVIHDKALYHYLSFLTTPAPQTLFDGVLKVPNGSWIRISEHGEVREHRYWDPLQQQVDLSGATEEEITRGLLDRLDRAVRHRMVSDVPVGIFLSGGVDSSTNAALFSRSGKGAVRAFSIGYPSDVKTYSDEIPFAASVAARVGADHYVKQLNRQDLQDFLPEMVRLQDEPIGDPVCVPVYYVSKLAREHGAIVCQVGEGADELFCGYPGWLRILKLAKANQLPVPTIVKRLGLAGLRMVGRDQGMPFEYLRRAVNHQPIFWGGAEAFSETAKRSLFTNDYLTRFEDYSSWEALAPIRQRFEMLANKDDDLKWMTYLDINFRLPELLLMRVDKMSMGVGLEARVPFLDAGVVEFAMGIPSAMQIKNGTPKYLLKKAVRGLIPDQIIDRPKQGFGVPMGEWFTGELVRNAQKDIAEFCNETGIFDADKVASLIRQTDSPQPWYLLNLAMWWKAYVA